MTALSLKRSDSCLSTPTNIIKIWAPEPNSGTAPVPAAERDVMSITTTSPPVTFSAEQVRALIAAKPTEQRISTPLLALAQDYLAWRTHRRSTSGTKRCAEYLSSFIDTLPDPFTVEQLTHDHVYGWLHSKSTWGPTTRRNGITALMALFNWALTSRRISANPLTGIEKPQAKSRTDFITAEQHQLILLACSDQAGRDLFTLAWETGARPQELRVIERRHCDLKNSRLLIPREEAKGRKRERVIYLSPMAQQIVQRLWDSHSSGPLLRNADGGPWTAYSINCRLSRIKTKLGIKTACLYGYRHGFAHRALDRGVDSLTVATLMGHVDTKMLAVVYGHVDQNKRLLQQALSSGPVSE